MTQEDAIKHWRREAQGSLTMARAGLREKEYTLALFHCHLAIEKALKARYMEERGEAAPFSHDLQYLASLLVGEPIGAHRTLLQELGKFSVQARYSDPFWAEAQATEAQTSEWIEKTTALLSHLLP